MRRSKKQIVAAAKTDKEPTKKNYTFRLDISLMESFESACEKEGVGTTSSPYQNGTQVFLAMYHYIIYTYM